MKAKFINEIQGFERNLSSKEALEIGSQHYKNIQKEIFDEATKKYLSFLNRLVGKTIIAKMVKWGEGRNLKEYSIEIKEIGYYAIEDPEVVIEDNNSEEYTLDINDFIIKYH